MPTSVKKLDEIECPKCGHPIPVSEALRHQLSEELKEQEKDVEKRVATAVSAALTSREKELKTREAQLSESERSIEKRVKDSVDQERNKLEADAKKRAEEAMSVEVQDTKSQLQETKEKLRLAEKAELDLRKRERELEEKQQNIELETTRQLSAQKAEVEESVSKKFAEEHRLKDHEKEKVIQDLKVALEDANRKAQQGSQQLQGEVQELDIESILKEQFPHDEIVPVPKGIRGADALQIVKMPSGTVCGSILWESKRTKGWSEIWIKKLKDDQREAKADI